MFLELLDSLFHLGPLFCKLVSLLLEFHGSDLQTDLAPDQILIGRQEVRDPRRLGRQLFITGRQGWKKKGDYYELKVTIIGSLNSIRENSAHN